MSERFNKQQGIIGFCGFIAGGGFFIFADSKWWAAGIFAVTVLVILYMTFSEKKENKTFTDTSEQAKILFIDDKECQIVKSLRRNKFDVRKIDDTTSPNTDTDIQWANLIFVDYKDIGKKLFGRKEGLGLINELKRIFGDKKRYVIYSSVQDFDGLTGFPYIRKNASYDEFISLITTEISKL